MIFEDGRFWAWEGIGCCPGTCGHVWEYSQGHARLFPEIERNLREFTDYGIAQRRDGSITFRGSNNGISAIDAEWYGKVHVLCSMYLAALRAGESRRFWASAPPPHQ
jgi:hypothetical protein